LKARALVGFALLLGVVTGCGPEFDRQSELKSFRVLAVQKDHPYARPGERVRLTMLDHDGADQGNRFIDRYWLAGRLGISNCEFP
jgi:hypothetical protein